MNDIQVLHVDDDVGFAEVTATYLEREDDRMEALIQDLLTLAREGGEMSGREPTDLTSVVESSWRNVETANTTLEIDLSSTVLANESRLKQVFENLIRNSVEHGGENVTVSIGKLVDGFFLSDDGPGIPESRRDDVFKTSYSTSQDGTGFGLSIVKHIVEAHGWNIRVTESPEGGTQFEITGVKFVEG